MPLILTLQLDPEIQAHFEALRQRYFPPEHNQIPAHLTMFHQLPDSNLTFEILEQASKKTNTFALEVIGLSSLGRGVAYSLASPALLSHHAQLAKAFETDLIRQDKQRFWPHIVVQNKVAPEAARVLLAELQRDFSPSTILARGLDLWRYLDGPWQHLQAFPFANPHETQHRAAHQVGKS